MQAGAGANQTDIREFEIELETTRGEKREYEYEMKNGREQAKVEIRSKDSGKSKREGQEALEDCRRLMERIGAVRQMTPEQIAEQACSVLDVSRDEIKKLEVEYEYADGMEVEVKIR